jgi:hypothetical protein
MAGGFHACNTHGLPLEPKWLTEVRPRLHPPVNDMFTPKPAKLYKHAKLMKINENQFWYYLYYA